MRTVRHQPMNMESSQEQFRTPLLSDDAIEAYADNWNEGVRGITIAHRVILVEGMDRARTIYEAARAKDAELIQQLVDALAPLHGTLSQTVFYDSFPAYVLPIDAALESAAAAGFTPSEP